MYSVIWFKKKKKGRKKTEMCNDCGGSSVRMNQAMHPSSIGRIKTDSSHWPRHLRTVWAQTPLTLHNMAQTVL